MRGAIVSKDQFQHVGDELIHRPTGARFTLMASRREVVWLDWGLAEVPFGDAIYRMEDIALVAHQVAQDVLPNDPPASDRLPG